MADVALMRLWMFAGFAGGKAERVSCHGISGKNLA